MKYLRIENALSGLISYAKIESIAGLSGDTKIANLAYNGIQEAYLYLKKEKAFEDMKLLLDHEETNVRLWVASFLLNIYEKESLEVLEEIARGDIHAFAAEMTMQEFKKGNLSF